MHITMKILKQQILQSGVEKSTSCQEDSRVNLFPSQGEERERYKSEQPTDCATKQREFGRICCKNHSGHTIRGWENFPTQSPVCSRNDGLPFDVDDLAISFPKWRAESIKAYGNAIVPQVAYEIFKAIETINKNIIKEE